MVPVIDMQEITQLLEEKDIHEETLHDFGKKLLSDLSSFGLVQLVSHGIPIVSWLFLKPLGSYVHRIEFFLRMVFESNTYIFNKCNQLNQ